MLFLIIAINFYLASSVFAVFVQRGLVKNSLLTILFSVFGIISQSFLITSRSGQVGFLAFASQFDAMALFALSVQTSGLILFLITRSASVKFTTDLISFVALIGALVSLPIKNAGLLNPLLNSPYFALHIITAFLGYGVFVSGWAWSLTAWFDRENKEKTIIPLKLAVVGLILLGVGIFVGAVWADNSWGNYWSWDVKESWALLTWLVFALYVHVCPLWKKRWLSILFYSLGIAVMLFTFIGINALKIGLHSH